MSSSIGGCRGVSLNPSDGALWRRGRRHRRKRGLVVVVVRAGDDDNEQRRCGIRRHESKAKQGAGVAGQAEPTTSVGGEKAGKGGEQPP